MFAWSRRPRPALLKTTLTPSTDVVPVPANTIPSWTHPPYSGFFDGERIWGRGASDDKSGLISIMNVLETLIGKGWTPVRGVVLAFGFDEEASGTHVSVLRRLMRCPFADPCLL